jgi:hypothetical protein
MRYTFRYFCGGKDKNNILNCFISYSHFFLILPDYYGELSCGLHFYDKAGGIIKIAL